MRRLTLAYCAFLLCAVLAWGQNAGPIDCDGQKVVLFKDAIGAEDCGNLSSPDGRYTLGWTLEPKIGASPVDWKLWGTDRDKFLDTYDFDPGDTGEYVSHDWLVDLHDQRLVALPGDDPIFPGESHGYLASAWDATNPAKPVGVIQREGKWYTDNLWLITFDKAGPHAVDLCDRLEKVILPIVRERRPLANLSDYSISYPIQKMDGDSPQSRPTMVAFHGGGMEIPFSAGLAHSQYAEDLNLEVDGTVTLSLPDGAVLSVTSSTPRDDPFRDDPELVRADQKLNDVYERLQKLLKAGDRAKLRKDQLDWIQERNGIAYDAVTAADNDGDPTHDLTALRNQALLKATADRAKELEGDLKNIRADGTYH